MLDTICVLLRHTRLPYATIAFLSGKSTRHRLSFITALLKEHILAPLYLRKTLSTIGHVLEHAITSYLEKGEIQEILLIKDEVLIYSFSMAN